jgi:hypothetical protein
MEFNMDVKSLILLLFLAIFSGCKTVEVAFVARYQDGPLSFEMQSR